MPHHHMDAHLGARQQGVKTIQSVVIVTLPQTFSGEAVWITQTPQSTRRARVTKTLEEETTTTRRRVRPTRTSSVEPLSTLEIESSNSSSIETSSFEVSSIIMETSSLEPSSQTTPPTTLMVATSSPLPSGNLASITSGPLASATSSGTPESGGMSGGAKAGLALGILLGVGALLGGVLFMYHRKKKKVQQEKLDNEKVIMEKNVMKDMPPPPPVDHDSDSLRTTRTMTTAPRLSLRPVTQFSPTLTENRKSAGNALDVGAALAIPRERTPSPSQPNSSASHGQQGAGAGPAENPFGDPHNPFGNDAATDSPPTSGQNTPNPPHLKDFGNPASAIAAADAGPTSAPLPVITPMTGAIPRKEVPAPLSLRSEAGALSFAQPSPAFTDDIPASPGPAPSGPPPIAVAGGRVNGPVDSAAKDNVHRVQLDFKPSMNDELELHAGQLVRMVHEYDDGWALCMRMDRSQQGVVPRTCLSKYAVKPRNGPPGPPRGGPPGPRMRGPPPMHGGVPQPRPLSPASGRNSPHPPVLSPANGRMSPAPRSMSPGPRAMAAAPRAMSPGPRAMSPGPRMAPGPRGRSNSNAPYAGPPRSMSPGPYGGSYQPPQAPMGRPRANSTGQVAARRGPAPGPSPMNPNAQPLGNAPMVSRKPLPGQAI